MRSSHSFDCNFGGGTHVVSIVLKDRTESYRPRCQCSPQPKWGMPQIYCWYRGQRWLFPQKYSFEANTNSLQFTVFINDYYLVAEVAFETYIFHYSKVTLIWQVWFFLLPKSFTSRIRFIIPGKCHSIFLYYQLSSQGLSWGRNFRAKTCLDVVVLWKSISIRTWSYILQVGQCVEVIIRCTLLD